MATKSPPKLPKMAPTKIQSKFRDNLLIGGFLLDGQKCEKHTIIRPFIPMFAIHPCC